MDNREIGFEDRTRYMEMVYDSIKWRFVLLVVLDELQALGHLKDH